MRFWQTRFVRTITSIEAQKVLIFQKIRTFFLFMSVKENIKKDLEELEKLYEKRTKLEKKKNGELLQHQVAFNEASKSIDTKFAPRFLPLNKEISAIEKRIVTTFEANRKPDGSFKLGNVETDKFIAEAYSTQSPREVDPKTFFNSVPESNRESMWSSFKVLIGNAEKLLGKETLDKLANVKTTWSFRIRKK